MNSDYKTINTLFVGILVVTFAGIANIVVGIFPTISPVNGFDLDLTDLRCFGVANYCDNNVDNSVTDSSNQYNDVNITDSFNPVTVPVQICGNNVESALTNSTSTCIIGDTDVSNGSPSTLGLS